MVEKGPGFRNGFDLDKQLDRPQTWILKNLRVIWLVFFAVSFLCLLLWFITVFLFPAGDARRERIMVPLDKDRFLILDYPKRFLADSEAAPIYVTADSSVPLSITLKLPTDLPLILVSAEPSSTIKIQDATNGVVMVDWPFFASLSSSNSPQPTPTGTSPVRATPSPTPAAIVPVLSEPHTISLYFRNARSERGFPFLAGFREATLTVERGANTSRDIPIQIETTDRASWRAFAQNYSFLAVLPFLVAAIGYLTRTYTERQKSQRQRAEEALEAFKQAVSKGDKAGAEKAKDSLDGYSKYLSEEDRQRAGQLASLANGELGSVIDVSHFRIWADVWAGALCLAADRLFADQSGSKEIQDTRATSINQEQMSKTSREDLYRYIRIFPTDLLSADSEKRLRERQNRLPKPQTHDWPKPAEPPKDYPVEPLKTIASLKLFPSATGDASQEIGYLFSQRRWYWDGHPLRDELIADARPTLVCGERGSGRTALALALTRYTQHAEKAMGCYHGGPATLPEVQLALVKHLLDFMRWRSTWLTELEREDRDLLAWVLVSVLNPDQLLSHLVQPEPSQFISPSGRGSQSVSEEDAKNRPIWEEQARVEFRLLQQSIRRMTAKPSLVATQWFFALSRCAQKLSFKRISIALDMTHEQFEQWRCAHLWQFRSALPIDFDIPMQLIMFVPGASVDFDGQKQGIPVRQLRWDTEVTDGKTLLMHMLEYRFLQRKNGEEHPPITDLIRQDVERTLCEAAQHNPRRLAALWQTIARQFPQAEEVTSEMVRAAREGT